MAEPQEPRRFPIGPPGAPLPRVWKAEPDPEPEPEVEEPKKKKKKGDGKPEKIAGGAGSKLAKKPKSDKKKAATSKDGKEKGLLVEETPALDTYQARQTARIITGVVIVGAVCLALFILVRVFSPPSDELEVAQDAPVDEGKQPPAPVNNEREARVLFERAREIAKSGKSKAAVELLEKVDKSYPNTKSAKEAREALARPAQNLPLFLDRPTVVATAKEPADPPAAKVEPPPTKAVEAAAPSGPDMADGDAKIVRPANPLENGLAVNTKPPGAADLAPSKPLPAGFRTLAGGKVHSSGWPTEIVGERDGAPMLLVPAGSFTMGRDDGENQEAPAHKVTVSTYYVDLHEVTIRQFELFVKENGARRERDRALAKEREREKAKGEPLTGESEDSPVTLVSARDAKDFAVWAGKQLPTEAQWEMAARSSDGRLFPWGNAPPQWDKPRKPRQIDPIRSYPADVSPFGIHDMAGNAWEWTKDWYDPKYYQPLKNVVTADPVGPDKSKSEQLTVRGSAKNFVVTKREGFKWTTRLPYLGFRCVLQVEGPGNAFEPPPAPGQKGPSRPGANSGVIPF